MRNPWGVFIITRETVLVFESYGHETCIIGSVELRRRLHAALDQLGPRERVLIVPPDITRFHSRAGELTRYAWEYYGDRVKGVLPALGTHYPMTTEEIHHMFGDMPRELFLDHDWRRDTVTLGTIPGSFLAEISEGRVTDDFPVQLSREIVDGGYDLILSIGQVVPHEVIGMANHSKNLLVGTGGPEAIHKSHFLGAAYGMERVMGRTDSPVRAVLDRASRDFLSEIPVVYVQTVVGRDGEGLALRGLFISDDRTCYEEASALAKKVNFEILDQPIQKAVVYLDPTEFRSTWLGNKAIYRTRMAMADDGELIVLAPGVTEFGEDPDIDRLIRKYGYAGTPEVLRLVEEHEDLRNNLCAAAHLIHGSTEGRFSVTYCAGGLTREEVESVHFSYANLDEMVQRYDPNTLREGLNQMPDGEEIFYISNPALGLWASKGKL